MKKGSKTSAYPSAADELRAALQPDKDGIRASVPVFGSGLNIQAAKIQGQPEDDVIEETMFTFESFELVRGATFEALCGSGRC